MTPETATGFKTLHAAALRPAALDLKAKELIAVACGVSRLCEGCIVHHVKAAKNAGATLEELQDTLDVCVLMGGGPASVYGKKALETWNATPGSEIAAR
jgi:AhpD family alkylhydroperoxidase